MNNPISIFHGITRQAGQPYVISRAQRSLGYNADYFCLAGGQKKNFPADILLTIEKREKGPESIHKFNQVLRHTLDNYDVIHLYSRPIFQRLDMSFPCLQDLILWRLANKVLIFNFRGTEARLPSVFFEKNGFNEEQRETFLKNGFFKKFNEIDQSKMITAIRAVASRVIVPDPELQAYIPGSIVVPRAIDLEKLPYVGPKNAVNPLVIHAPSSRTIKGTEEILRVVESLKSQGEIFRFELVENLSQADALEKYKEADIIIDQLNIGWYGVLAAEAMSLGKVAVTYIRPDLISSLPDPLPLVPTSFGGNNLEEIIKRLIREPETRAKISLRARTFCEEVHDSLKVGQKLIEIYNDAKINPDPVMVHEISYLIEEQSIRNVTSPSQMKNLDPLNPLAHAKHPSSLAQILRKIRVSIQNRGLKETTIIIYRFGMSYVIEKLKRYYARKIRKA